MYELGKILPSCNLAAKFKFGTWHELGMNLAVIKYHASGISSTTMVCFTTVDIIILARCSWPAKYYLSTTCWKSTVKKTLSPPPFQRRVWRNAIVVSSPLSGWGGRGVMLLLSLPPFQEEEGTWWRFRCWHNNITQAQPCPNFPKIHPNLHRCIS